MFTPILFVYIWMMLYHPKTEVCQESTIEIELMNSRMIFFWLCCHAPYQIAWTVMLAVKTGPMWYFKWTNFDELSNFLESPNIESNWTLVLLWGHGRHTIVRLGKRSTVMVRSAKYRGTQPRRIFILMRVRECECFLCFWLYTQYRLQNLKQMELRSKWYWGLWVSLVQLFVNVYNKKVEFSKSA